MGPYEALEECRKWSCGEHQINDDEHADAALVRINNICNAALGAASSKENTFPESPTWPYVLAFALEMEAKLAMNRHKGSREGWVKAPILLMLHRLFEEARELEDALNGGAAAQVVVGEAADVANFAMMIADIAVEWSKQAHAKAQRREEGSEQRVVTNTATRQEVQP